MDGRQLAAAFGRLEERRAAEAASPGGARVGATLFLKEVEGEAPACCEAAVSVQSRIDAEPGSYELDDALGMLVVRKRSDYFIPYDDVAHVEVWRAFC